MNARHIQNRPHFGGLVISLVGGFLMTALPCASFAASPTIQSMSWNTVNDTVMGGRSQAQISVNDNKHLLWTGNLSLENNGGFVSIRSEYTNLDWSQYDGVEVQLSGAGRDVQVSLQRRDQMIRAGGYRALVPTHPTEDTRVFIPFTAFVLKRFGRAIQGPALEGGLKAIGQLGLLIADKREGEFRVVLKSINPVRHSSKTRLKNDVGAKLIKAIEKGVPTFNGGDAEGCASIYREVLTQLSQKGHLGKQTWAEQTVQHALARAKEEDRVSAAWTLRRAMDAVLRSL